MKHNNKPCAKVWQFKRRCRRCDSKQSDATVNLCAIVAPNPNNGNMQQFVSPAIAENPAPYMGDSVKVTVDWSNPKAYIMDVSFLPFKVE